MDGGPTLLDLFCGAGGAAMGYHRAGFKRIVGVDNRPQPNYPFEFILADAMTFPLEGFDLIHASPPCQAYTTLSAGRKERYPDLYAEVRCLLSTAGVPWVIENVIGAPYETGIVLCGSMFGLKVRRHRHFESSGLLLRPSCNHAAFPNPILVSGKGGGNTLRHRKGVKSEWPQIMGMPWATPEECTQGIPPAYTYWIGCQAMVYLGYDKKDSFVYGGWLPAEALRAEPLLAPLQADEAARDNRSLRADTEALL